MDGWSGFKTDIFFELIITLDSTSLFLTWACQIQRNTRTYRFFLFYFPVIFYQKKQSIRVYLIQKSTSSRHLLNRRNSVSNTNKYNSTSVEFYLNFYNVPLMMYSLKSSLNINVICKNHLVKKLLIKSNLLI